MDLLTIDSEIVDLLAALAGGSATDADLAEARARRARVEDRLSGARTLVQRAEIREALHARAAKEAALALLTKAAGQAEWDAVHTSWGERGITIAKLARELHDEIVVRCTQATIDSRHAEGMARELGIEVPHLPRWAPDNAGIVCARAIARKRMEEQRNHDDSRMLQWLAQRVLE